jgi:hypothetical protein
MTAAPSPSVTRTPKPTATSTPEPAIARHPARAAAPRLSNSAQSPRLELVASPTRIAANGYTTVLLQTVRHAQVLVTLRLADQRPVLATQRGHVVRLLRDVTLFRTSISGMADRLGRFRGSLHVTCMPRKPMVATITVEVRSGHGMATGRTEVTVNPKN